MPLQSTRRVSRHEPCPICGRPDWCLVALNSRYAVCMRVPSDHPAKGNNGGYIHYLDGGRDTPINSTLWQPTKSQTHRLASVDRRHTVYSRLLAAASLDARHQKELLARGCTAEEIATWHCGTLTRTGRGRMARECHNGHPDDLLDVPGFCLANSSFDNGTYWTVSGQNGLLIPCFGPDSKIRGIRIRVNDKTEKNKYRWLSSAGMEGGTGSGVHCHVARPRNVIDSALWITEGEIKVNISAARLGAIGISIPGVSSWALALPDIITLLPGGGSVVIAMDSDWREKLQVHLALWRLAQACHALGYSVRVAIWEPTHKGLDDLLVAGVRPTLTELEQIPAPDWTLKVTSAQLAEATAPRTIKAVTLDTIRENLNGVFAAEMSQSA